MSPWQTAFNERISIATGLLITILVGLTVFTFGCQQPAVTSELMATPVPTSTQTREPTPTQTREPTPMSAPTDTPIPEPAATPVPTSTQTPELAPTSAPTATPIPELTATPAPTATPILEPTATLTSQIKGHWRLDLSADRYTSEALSAQFPSQVEYTSIDLYPIGGDETVYDFFLNFACVKIGDASASRPVLTMIPITASIPTGEHLIYSFNILDILTDQLVAEPYIGSPIQDKNQLGLGIDSLRSIDKIKSMLRETDPQIRPGRLLSIGILDLETMFDAQGNSTGSTGDELLAIFDPSFRLQALQHVPCWQ